jgi:hypothetical protein
MEKNELNSLAEFLSFEASDYITRSTVVVDSGQKHHIKKFNK